MSADSTVRFVCTTAQGIDDCLQRTAAARAAADAAADAVATGPVRTTWDDDSDAALVAAMEAAEQAERARQARRRPMCVDRLFKVANILVLELDIIALEKFRRLSRDARDCATQEHERRNPRRSFVVLLLVLGFLYLVGDTHTYLSYLARMGDRVHGLVGFGRS